MAFFTNNKNVGQFLFVKNNEILVTNTETLHLKDIKETNRLKFVSSAPNAETKAPANSDKQPVTEPNFITSAALSNCNTLIAAGYSNNCLHLWKIDGQSWKAFSTRSIVRKCQKIIFTNSTSEIILADRGGDVFSYSVSKFEDPGRFLLGHICLILDISISSNDKYLATCDRDGKIRVSSYPNAYSILSYCLGHQEFVTSLKFVNEGMLVSCSGDGTLRLWDFKEGSMKAVVNLHENDLLVGTENGANVDKSQPGMLSDNLALSEKQVLFSVRSVIYNEKFRLFAVLFHMQCGIGIYQLSDEDLVFKQFLVLKNPPLDAIFTVSGDIIVLCKDKGNATVCFEYNEVSQVFLKVTDDVLLNEIVQFYSDHEHIPFQDDFVSLFKRVYDCPDDDDDECKPKKNKTE